MVTQYEDSNTENRFGWAHPLGGLLFFVAPLDSFYGGFS